MRGNADPEGLPADELMGRPGLFDGIQRRLDEGAVPRLMMAQLHTKARCTVSSC
jgi:hypothetical protein